MTLPPVGHRNARMRECQGQVSQHGLPDQNRPAVRLVYRAPVPETLSRTRVAPLAFDAERGVALVAVRLQTGRTHQARVHLAHAVGAIAGDHWYGDTGPKRGRVALHAAWLRIPAGPHLPAVDVNQPPSPDFWALACSDGVSADLSLPEDWLGRLQAMHPGAVRNGESAGG